MKNVQYMMRHLSTILNVGIFGIQNMEIVSYTDAYEHHLLYTNEQLRDLLVQGALKQDAPYIYIDKYQVYFSCIREGDCFFMIGPMSIKILSSVESHQFYKEYGFKAEEEKRLKKFSFAEILDIVEIVSHYLTGMEYEDSELIRLNHLMIHSEDLEEEKVLFTLKTEEKELYHHTYLEERKLLDCVRMGDVADALRLNRQMDMGIGILSTKELNHLKNTAIVGITLCTRAAIEGGVSPAIAYRMSDFYIQKCDSCMEAVQVIEYRNHAVRELTKCVLEKKSRKTSNYVEQSKDYVEKHYRDKIYLDEIAGRLGISSSYLSRMFKQESGIRLQDYIIKVRLEHAANLLKYSEETISNIAEYVNFPSQSYMGKHFKERYHMSPKKYRETYKPTEYFGG